MRKTKTTINPESYTDDLKARLAKAEISHSALAEKAEIDPTQISRWFNTKMEPSLRNVRRLEAAFAALTK